MASFFQNHLIYSTNFVPASRADLRRYEGFFPNMKGDTYDPISLAQDKTQNGKLEVRKSPSRVECNDDDFSNASSLLFCSEDSSNSSQSQTYTKETPFSSYFNGLDRAKFYLKTPQKTSEKRISPRKPLRPVKSANHIDPNFRGVTLQLKTSLKRKRKTDTKAQLIINCCFSAKKKRRNSDGSKNVQRRSSSPKFNPSIYKMSSSPGDVSTDGSFIDDDLGVAPIHVEKECASCATIKTPLWRDAEDGTPLCNACGIRYKKYRIRCLRCWYIPKKEEKALPCCTSCGHVFKVTLGRRGNSFEN